MKKIWLILLLVSSYIIINSEILIPMDNSQSNHLRAYGIVFRSLQNKQTSKWLLNYRGGAFLCAESQTVINDLHLSGVTYEIISANEVASIYNLMNEENMDVILLEVEPKIAVYSPPNKVPWDDAVTLALTYAGIEYETLWDEEVITKGLDDYDWVHLHHEDFTGQFGKFYSSYRFADWYQEEVRINEEMANKLGFNKVWQLKHAVAEKIRAFVVNGGFLFAMCGATDTIDIALAASNVDIVPKEFDGDGIDPNYRSKLDFTRTLAFENFKIEENPMIYEYSDIDGSDYAAIRGAEADYFQLFDFSAKFDPVPTMLTQNHGSIVDGFLGMTTSFKKNVIKKSVIILGDIPNSDETKYIHGNLGKGTFTFYGGHDPEDYRHLIGDPETVLDLHKNSQGYRLILNNVLFPAAEKKKLKT
ncbi:asparagine synthetase B [bacterium]|nr:asparagine synthetase B [bacterium]